MSLNWFLIQAKARQESFAELNLQRLGVETFFPCFSQTRNRCRNQEAKKSALFPGYLFVRMDISTEFRKVTYAHGVLGVVKFGSAPALVVDDVIYSIKARQSNQLVDPSPTYSCKSGETVGITKGPMRGFQALFERKLNGTQRVALLLKTIAYQGRIVIDRDCLAI